MSLRPVRHMYKSTPTLEGAGVKLHRAFGFGKTEDFDPFLLLDDFRNVDHLHIRVENLLWKDDHHGSLFAKAVTAGAFDRYRLAEPAPVDFFTKRLLNHRRTERDTTRPAANSDDLLLRIQLAFLPLLPLSKGVHRTK